MTFTYTGDPSASDVEEVRFNIGDTDSTRPMLSDEEIQHVIDTTIGVNGSLLWVSAQAALRASAKYAGEVNVSGDGVSVDVEALQGKLKDAYTGLMTAYRASLGGAPPDVGGIDAVPVLDGSVAPPAFGVGGSDNYRAGNQHLENTSIYPPADVDPYGGY